MSWPSEAAPQSKAKQSYSCLPGIYTPGSTGTTSHTPKSSTEMRVLKNLRPLPGMCGASFTSWAWATSSVAWALLGPRDELRAAQDSSFSGVNWSAGVEGNSELQVCCRRRAMPASRACAEDLKYQGVGHFHELHRGNHSLGPGQRARRWRTCCDHLGFCTLFQALA